MNYFEKLFNKIEYDNYRPNNLVLCLMKLTDLMNLNISWETFVNVQHLKISDLESLEVQLKIRLYPIMTSFIDQMTQSPFPVLVQGYETDDYKVIINNKVIYNPKTSVKETLNEINIIKAWQCYPVNFPKTTGLMSLIVTVIKNFKKDILLALLLGLVVATGGLLISIFSAYIFSHLHEFNHRNHYWIFITTFLVLLSSSILSCYNNLHVKSINFKVLFIMLPSIWYHILYLPIKTAKAFLSGDLVQRLFDYEIVIALLVSSILHIVLGFSALFILMVFMLSSNTVLAASYVIVCILFLIIKLSTLPKSLAFISAQLVEQGRLTSLMNEILLQINKIRTANVENQVYKKYILSLIKAKIHAEKYIKLDILAWGLSSLLPIMLMLSLYGMLNFNTVEPSIILQFLICGGQFTIIFEKLSADLIILATHLPSLKRIQPFMSENIEINDSLSCDFTIDKDIEFQNIYLKSMTTGKWILDNVSINLPCGKFIALVGPSGAGKSSLFKLLLGFESASAGSILLNNDDIKNLNRNHFRKQIGVVLQATNMLPGTIFSNISANTSLCIDEAWALAKYVALDEEIEQMPMKMYTIISDNVGESISGGQKQKILIARALATQPKLLLLDEATSALDNQSQAIIYASLKQLKITRFVITHRYSTIIDADQIYVLNEGKVVDSGIYSELLHRKHLSP